jgi:hypothetical protein
VCSPFPITIAATTIAVLLSPHSSSLPSPLKLGEARLREQSASRRCPCMLWNGHQHQAFSLTFSAVLWEAAPFCGEWGVMWPGSPQKRQVTPAAPPSPLGGGGGGRGATRYTSSRIVRWSRGRFTSSNKRHGASPRLLRFSLFRLGADRHRRIRRMGSSCSRGAIARERSFLYKHLLFVNTPLLEFRARLVKPPRCLSRTVE